MDISIIVISILGVAVVILGFTTWNLLSKTEKQEDQPIFIEMGERND